MGNGRGGDVIGGEQVHVEDLFSLCERGRVFCCAAPRFLGGGSGGWVSKVPGISFNGLDDPGGRWSGVEWRQRRKRRRRKSSSGDSDRMVGLFI